MTIPSGNYSIPSNLPELPVQAASIVKQIQSGEILGASRSIRLLNEAFCIQVDNSENKTGKALANDVRIWSNYLIRTRGALSPAVGNALEIVFHGLEEAAESDLVEDVRSFVHKRTKWFNKRSFENVQRIASTCANLFNSGQTVLVYDYSSSVNYVLEHAYKQGKRLHVIIPESRALNGGLPIMREVIDWGHNITFTVDVAAGRELENCDGVLVGAESLTVDGGFWNTVGTSSLAVLAKHHRVRFYVPTELIKFDKRSINGVYRKVVRSQLEIFDYIDLSSLSDRVLVECDDLEFTKRDLVTAYITENGVLPPQLIASAFANTMEHP